ncbi:MAG: GNVR domain-containing protein [Desulfobacterales bacterium]|nr:GNVR domain-containing protein [Desulfobacterales bacterium]
MTEVTPLIKPDKIFEAIARRRWYLLVSFCAAMAVGIYLARTLPRLYEANTTILVQPQGVPSQYVQSIVSSGLESRIKTISQQIKSRTNLERIIEMFHLFSKPDQADMFVEKKMELLRKRINVEFFKTGDYRREEASGFSISFKGEDPETVMKVTNTLATYFIDENLKVRESQAVGTNVFLEDELKIMRTRLEGQESALKIYREKYMGGLPEQLETNLRIIDSLQASIIQNQKSLREAKTEQMFLEKELPELGKQAETNLPDMKAPEEAEADDSKRLENLKALLEELENKYTERHPDVIRTRNLVKEMESRPKKASPEKPKQTLAQKNVAFELIKNKTLLTKRIRDLSVENKALTEEISNLSQKAAKYARLVEQTPKREQELLSLKRDYQNIRETYNSLLNRKLEATLAVNMEKKQKGEQFSILDPAKLPEMPVEPNMKKLFIAFVVGGLGFGAGLIFLLEKANSAYKDKSELEKALGLPVLATVTKIYQPRHERLRWLNFAASSILLVISILLLAGFAFVALKAPGI